MTANTALAVTIGAAIDCHGTATQFRPVNVDYCHEVPCHCPHCHSCSGYRGWQYGSKGPQTPSRQSALHGKRQWLSSAGRGAEDAEDYSTNATAGKGLAG